MSTLTNTSNTGLTLSVSRMDGERPPSSSDSLWKGGNTKLKTTHQRYRYVHSSIPSLLILLLQCAHPKLQSRSTLRPTQCIGRPILTTPNKLSGYMGTHIWLTPW